MNYRFEGKKWSRLWISISVLIILLVISYVVNMPYFTFSLIFALILVILALSWDFSSGVTGYVNFGLPFFVGVGAFSSGYLYYTYKLPVPFLLFISFLLGITSGFLFSIPTLRVRGPFFTLLSLLLPLLGTDFILAFWTVLGLPTIGYYNLPTLSGSLDYVLLIVTAITAVISFVLYWITQTHFGLVLRGIGDDEDAIISNGLNTFPYKLVTFSLAMGIVSLGGAIYALFTSYAGVDTFGFTFLMYPMLIAILGGRGSIAGSLPAGIIIVLLSQYLSLYIGSLTLIIFSILAILLLLFFPKGLMRSIQ
ncbi:MAG: branched-chain amino acid ABC transporter permease [Candidatus Thermoplasmatota archaeon]|jgi:branched-chain amino acid transport system permease protein|nr:branched-chain amino acid ABC transporter permease [Candidatus Thermoplasmatota archaeon]